MVATASYIQPCFKGSICNIHCQETSQKTTANVHVQPART